MIVTGIVLGVVAGFPAVVWAYMKLPQFGSKPTGERLARIQASPQYRDGAFQNQSDTPQFTDGGTFPKVMRRFFFEKNERKQPQSPIPAVKTDLHNLKPDEDVLIWMGHSSYYMQVDGKRILVDPVLSGHASPVSVSTRSFKGADVYSVADIPETDYLIITHDHYDHLDYKTVKALKGRVKKVITGLGTGAHLERWGYDSAMITEMDWHEESMPDNGFTLTATPARHFSGRSFKRNTTIWTSFVLQTPTHKIFIGGDSGYDSHFAETGKKYGPFDVAILECGQYNQYWKHIHMMPEETVQAAQDLQAAKLLPVHWSKFALSLHDWDEPVKRVVAEAGRKDMPLILPVPGAPTYLKGEHENKKWWEQMS